MIASVALLALAAASAAAPRTAGERLYRSGSLPSGAPVRAAHAGGASIEGAGAACVNCHRRSGLGSIEGQISVPPIAGPYLFLARGKTLQDAGIPFVDTMRVDHAPYTDATLARAIRDGIGSDGRPLNYLMPRYELDEAAMAELVSYLKGMKVGPAPGVEPSVLHFATIITPDADPLKRRAMLDVLNQYFVDKNAAVARSKAPALSSAHRTMFRVQRRWQLHVWELTGSPPTWPGQLRKHLAAEPVYAVISGLAGSDWAPVQRFCEEEGLPCLFPNVEAPEGSDDDFYSVYFSRGVLLDAQLIARELADAAAPKQRVVQVYRAGDVGARAAQALRALGAAQGREVTDRVVAQDGSATELRAAVRAAGPDEALVLWLRGTDLESLPAPPPARSIWVSGEMAGLDLAPLPAAWREVTRMAYAADLPTQRVARIDYALGWFRIRQIPVAAQQLQVDTYLACGLLSETLSHMVDAFVRDYLLERVEMALDHRVLTGYYPRLTLAPGQRFASKGGYLVRFADAKGNRVTPVSDWIVP